MDVLAVEVIFALICAAFFTTAFAAVRRLGFGLNAWSFFLLVFLLALNGGRWIKTTGLSVWGINWPAFVFPALIASLFLALTAPFNGNVQEVGAGFERPLEERVIEFVFLYLFLVALLLVLAIFSFMIRI